MMMTSVSVVGATFHPGDRGDQIVAIQNALVRNGSDIAVDGDYGTGTKEAVKAFQERHGLDVDGIVGAQTYEALMGAAMPENVSSHFIEKKAIKNKGKENLMFPLVTADNAISVVQQALANKGYNLDVDGVFGVGTEQAVRKFQADNGLDVDGVVGKTTFYALTGEALPGGPLPEEYAPAADPAFAAELMQCMEQDKLYLDPKLTLTDVANAVGTNRTYLSDYINRRLGTTFYEYVNAYRVREAAALLLAEPSMPLSEVADRCGFGSLSTFRRSFAKGMKRTPMEYRIKELNLPLP